MLQADACLPERAVWGVKVNFQSCQEAKSITSIHI